MHIARSELILGGQKSGKSARAEQLAAHWLAQHPAHRAVLLATAWADPADADMRQRIARHQSARAQRAPGLHTLETPRDLPQALLAAGGVQTLRVVDCLTLWLTQLLMPPPGWPPAVSGAVPRHTAALLHAISACPGPVVLVGNEIGLGVIPLGRDVRAFVDALGTLNQQVAATCQRVTLMAAGLPLVLKANA